MSRMEKCSHALAEANKFNANIVRRQAPHCEKWGRIVKEPIPNMLKDLEMHMGHVNKATVVQ